jgi:DNA (cytosine-5)-methyltransferase 1
MEHLDLFSGVGGFAVAARKLGISTRQFVEIDPFCQQVLALRFPGVPVHSNIQSFQPKHDYDIITAGFPCQDISGANPNGQGIKGSRSGLFFEVIRILRECRPRYLLLENVSALLTQHKGRTMGTVLWELSQSGYDAEWSVVSSCALGATHTRERVFVVAYPNSIDGQKRLAVHPHNQKLLQCRNDSQSKGNRPLPATSITGMVNGIPHRVDRLRALGNAVDPIVAEFVMRAIS